MWEVKSKEEKKKRRRNKRKKNKIMIKNKKRAIPLREKKDFKNNEDFPGIL